MTPKYTMTSEIQCYNGGTMCTVLTLMCIQNEMANPEDGAHLDTHAPGWVGVEDVKSA